MDQGPLSRRIIEAFPGMSGQLQTAARYILDKPRDVALLSMREQARQAGVQPATMTRLARHLGLPGYEAIRELYADAARRGELGFAGKAGIQAASQQFTDRAVASELFRSLGEQIAAMDNPAMLDRLAEAAKALAAARRIHCLGLRSCHAVAWHLYYVLSLLGDQAVLLDGVAGVGIDPLHTATPDDVLLATSISPYTRATIEAATYGHQRGVPIIAITDSGVAPLALMATQTIIVPTSSPSFFHTLTPAFMVAEFLAALVASERGALAVEMLKQRDEQLSAINAYLDIGPIER